MRGVVLALLAGFAGPARASYDDCLVDPVALFGYRAGLGPRVVDEGEGPGVSARAVVTGDLTFPLGTRGVRLGPWGDGAFAADPSVEVAGGLGLTFGRAPAVFRDADYMSEGGAFELRAGPGMGWEIPGLQAAPAWHASVGWTTRNDVQTMSTLRSEWCPRGRWDRKAWMYRGLHGTYFAVGGGLRADVSWAADRWSASLMFTWSPGFERDLSRQLRAGLAPYRAEPVPGDRSDVHTPPMDDGRVSVKAGCGDAEPPPWLALVVTSRGAPVTGLRELREAFYDVEPDVGGVLRNTWTGCSHPTALLFTVDDWREVDALAAELVARLRGRPAGHELWIVVQRP